MTEILLALLVASELGRWLLSWRNYRIEKRYQAERLRQYEEQCRDFAEIYGPRSMTERKGAVAN